MKIKCLHGYFIFEEFKPGDISRFASLYDATIVKSRDHFTFEELKDAPKYSIQGTMYLGSIATTTFEGEPWEVMKANNLVYDFKLGAVVPISLITKRVQIDQASGFLIASGLIMPGSFTNEGLRVTDYAAWYLFDTQRFKYIEVNNV